MVSIEKAPRFTVQVEFGKLFPSQKGIENYNGGGMDSLLQKMYSDPQLFEKLFETLGGEFFVGSFSEAPKFENFRQSNGNYLGVSGAYRVNSHFEAKVQFSAYKTQITADFPIIVFDQNSFETQNLKGNLTTDLKTKTLGISGNYYPLTGIIQPYAGVGVLYSSTNSSVTKAQMGEVVFDLSENPKLNSFGLTFNTGVALIIHSNIILQVNGQLFSVAAPNGGGTVWNKVLSGGVGVRF
jgi:hypothetical protein